MKLFFRVARFILEWFFGFKAFNDEVLHTKGPVLLIPNHVSWFDWLLIGASLDSDWRFVTSSTTAQTSFVHRFFMINSRTFPIDTASPYAVKRMAEFLSSGGRLVLFAEGRISRTGELMKLFDGTGFLLHKTNASVITCRLRGASRFVFSPNSARKLWFPKVSTHYSNVQTPPKIEGGSAAVARQKITAWLRDLMTEQNFEVEMQHGPENLLQAVRAAAAVHPGKIAVEDATLQTLSYRKLLVGAEVLGSKMPFATPARQVGVLLPNLNATAVTLLALWGRGSVPAVLNFSTGIPVMLACSKLADLQQIITSRKFLEKAKIPAQPFLDSGIELVYLEDLRQKVSTPDRLKALLRFTFDGGGEVWPLKADDSAVILFTSGSEGVPKGVELTHRNILANIRQVLSVTDIEDKDRLFNCLPMFHSFGLCIGTFLPLVRGMYVFLYPSPLHYRIVPSALYDRDCTVFLSTNTFLNGYSRRAHPYDFRSMRYLFAAAEKLQEATATLWAQKYGVRILEGYGATECAPCISVNTPLQPRHASVGRALPGIEVRIEPVDGVPEGGRLMVRGPNIMKGYLNEDANAKFKALEGWYDTGDIVHIDDEGFMSIRGRLKRFAKVSGEMVSLTAVEDALAGAFPQYGARCQIAVVTRPDHDKGEALIAVSNEPKLRMDEIRAAVKAKGLSNLCVPREVAFMKEIPKLGTGKLNHREVERIIRETPPPA